MSRYTTVYQSEFESWLTDIKDDLRPNFSYWSSITDEFNTLQGSIALQSKEAIYEIFTRNSAFVVRIYSSILEREEVSRKKGADRVRVILRWQTRNGNLFFNYKELNRVAGLEGNLRKVLTEIAGRIDRLAQLRPWIKEADFNR